MKYEEPIVEVLKFEKQDVITLSVDIGDGESTEGDWSN